MIRFLLSAFVFCSFTLFGRQPGESAGIPMQEINRVSNADLKLEFPRFIFTHTQSKIIVSFENPKNAKLLANNRELHFIVNGEDRALQFDAQGKATLIYVFRDNNEFNILFEDAVFRFTLPVLSIWIPITPLLLLMLFLPLYILKIRKKKSVPSDSSKSAAIVEEAS